MIMKAKYLWVVLLSLSFFGCDDNTGTLGLGMFPGSDQNINGKLATFNVTTSSEKAGDVFAKTSIAYLGRFTDPDFGFYEAGFLTQLHCIQNFKFPAVYDKNNPNDPNAVMVKNEVYRTELSLIYTSYFGDSLTASRMSVYELNNDLDKEAAYYTSINPELFYDRNNPASLLGRKAYTAVDLSVKDSIRNLGTYVPYITVTLPQALGQKILLASRSADEAKQNFADIFTKDVFKGIYVKNDYGDGTILYIDQIELRVIYEVYAKNDTTGINLKKYNSDLDSTEYRYSTFAVTKEIIQANSFKSDGNKIEEKLNETDCTYLKTPAGIYTQAKLPLKDIRSKLSQDTLNVAKLTFTNYNQVNDNNKFSMNAPDYVLLVREKDKENFFKDNKVTDNITSYLAKHNYINTNQYVFSNLSQLVNVCIAEKEAAKIAAKSNEGSSWNEENWETEWTAQNPLWDKVAIIPVTVNADSNGSIISILNDLRPGYAKLKGGEGEGRELSFEIIYTSFNKE